MKASPAAVRDSLRATLWPIPTLGLVAAIALGVLVPTLDRRLDASMPAWLSDWIFNGDAGAAQTVLDAVSSSLITVTSLTFSLTVVTLQLASSQFSPRLLRTFSRDLFVQVTLAIFLSTFVYSLTVLRLVRSSDGTAGAFVPRGAVTLAFLLAVTSVFALVLFLAHLTRSIRVETMLRNVHREATVTMHATLRERDRPGSDCDTNPPAVPASAEAVLAPQSGFVVGTDQPKLLDAATKAGAVVTIEVCPGSFVVEGVPLGHVWSDNGGPLPPGVRDSLAREVGAALRFGFERTAGEDIAFGLRQLTDVANKALSPAVNDPTTAVHAIGHLSVLLSDLADRELGPRVLRDDTQPRVVLARPSFADLIELAITQPRRYGASDPEVVSQLFRLLAQLAYRASTDLHPIIVLHVERLEATVAAQDYDDHEVAVLADLTGRVRSILDHRHE
jgi:uncharacterized membrane protein